MTREHGQRSTDGQDVLNLATNLAGLRTSEDDHLDQKVLRGGFNPEKANTPEPVVDDDPGLAPAAPEGILDEPEGDEDGPPPKEDCILFVGDLARAMSDADLERAFASVGKVIMTDIKRDKVTGRNLGYGFVQMSTREEALAARERMQGAEIQGRRIRVGWAQRNTMLFVGDLDETVTLDVLAEAFGRFGPLLPEHTYVRSGKFGRYGGVRFQSRQHAEMARREMNGVRLGAFPIRVAWHHTQPGGPNVYHGAPFMMGGGGGGDGGGPPRPYSVHVQFEANPNEAVVSESLMHSIFAPFGEVMAVILPQGRGILSREGDGPTGPCCRGYGFIHFSGTALGRKCALEAIRALNGQVVDGVHLSTCFSKKPMGRPRPSSAPPGRMGGRPARAIMVMDHHAGGVGDVAMGFRPIAMPSPTDPSGGMGLRGGGYPGMDGPMLSGGRGGGGGSWGPPMQHFPPGPGPHSGNLGSPGMMQGGPPPYGPGAPYGYGPYPPAYAGYPPQPLQPQPYYGGHPYAGYGAYPMYGGPDGPMPPPPAYMQGPGSNAGSSGPGSGEEPMVGPPGPGYGDPSYGNYGPPLPAGMHHMGPGRPIPLSGAGGHPAEGFPAGGL